MKAERTLGIDSWQYNKSRQGSWKKIFIWTQIELSFCCFCDEQHTIFCVISFYFMIPWIEEGDKKSLVLMIKTKIQTMQGHQITLHLLKGVFMRQLNDKMIKNDKMMKKWLYDSCTIHQIICTRVLFQLSYMWSGITDAWSPELWIWISGIELINVIPENFGTRIFGIYIYNLNSRNPNPQLCIFVTVRLFVISHKNVTVKWSIS